MVYIVYLFIYFKLLFQVLSDPMLDQETLPDIVQKLIDFSVRGE